MTTTTTIRATHLETPSNSKMPGAKRHLSLRVAGEEVRFVRGEAQVPVGAQIEMHMGATVTGIGSRRRSERHTDTERVVVTGVETDEVDLVVQYASNCWHVRVSGVRRVEA